MILTKVAKVLRLYINLKPNQKIMFETHLKNVLVLLFTLYKDLYLN